MSFPAFFDTNVLYGAILNDLMLELAERGLFRPLWSEDVQFELGKNLVKNGERPELVDKRIGTMKSFFSDAMVSGYEDLIPQMTNDQKDRHVLAAAVRGGAEVLVTFNLVDFPATSVERFEVEVVHPDEFLLDQLDLYPSATMQAVVDLIDSYDSPAMTPEDFFLALMRAGVPQFGMKGRSLLY